MSENLSAKALDDLADGVVLRDRSGDVFQKRGGWWCSYETAAMPSHRLQRYGPFEFLSVQHTVTHAQIEEVMDYNLASDRLPTVSEMAEFLELLGMDVKP